MGFFSTDRKKNSGPSPEILHQLGCRACPLNKLTCNKHPHMEPTGVKKPLVYILGEAPGEDEDEDGEQFIGKSGQLLRARIPPYMRKRIRFNNVVRTRPPNNRNPTNLEIECCRPSVEEDIAASKPIAIFGFGNIALKWASGFSGITMWRGRRFPINIRGHECWFYPMLHPAFLLRQRSKWAAGKGPKAIGSENERAFVFDLKRAFAEVDKGLPPAVVHDRKVAEYGVEIYPGGPGQLEKLRKSLEWAKRQKVGGVDYETNKLRPYYEDSKILTAAFGTDEVSFAFAIDHPGAKWTRRERKEVVRLWKDFLLAPTLKVVHNLPFEQVWTGKRYGYKYLRASPWGCSLTQAHTLDERRGEKGSGKKKGEGGPLSLEFLCYQNFGINIKKLNPVNRKNLAAEPVEKVLLYNAVDGKYHFLLYGAQKERLLAEELNGVYKRTLRRVSTCTIAQLEGMLVDQEETERLKEKYSKAVKSAMKALKELPEVAEYKRRFKVDFNPDSPDDVSLMLRKVIKSKEGLLENGKYSTDKNVLARVKHPISPLILKVRQSGKKISTYCYCNSEDKHILWPGSMIHAVFNHGTSTTTDRLSSEDPNLQNVPKREEGNREVRKQIVAPPGHSIVLIDYGQIQHRAFAMAAKDRRTIKELWDRHDVHGEWAERIAHAYPARIGGKQYLKDKDVMKTFRTDIKNQWTFPIYFGAQLSSVAGYLKIPEEDIAQEYEDFKENYEETMEWQKTMLDFYREHNYVQGLLGYRRRGPMSPNEVINTPIQNAEAEIVMDRMNALSEYATETGDMYYHPRVQVHDELQYILPDDKLDQYLEPIVTKMLAVPFKFVNVPITVEVSFGPNLLEIEKAFDASSDNWN